MSYLSGLSGLVLFMYNLYAFSGVCIRSSCWHTFLCDLCFFTIFYSSVFLLTFLTFSYLLLTWLRIWLISYFITRLFDDSFTYLLTSLIYSHIDSTLYSHTYLLTYFPYHLLNLAFSTHIFTQYVHIYSEIYR